MFPISVLQSSQFPQEAFTVLHWHSLVWNWQATMKTHTSQSSLCSHTGFAVGIPELDFTSVTGCLSSLLFRSPAGYPKQYQLCNGEGGSFLPKVLVVKSQTTEWNSVCQSPNWKNKTKPSKKNKKLFHPPIFPVSPNSPWLMASTLENIRFFQSRRTYVPTTVPFQGKS